MFYEGVIIRERNQSPRVCLGRLHTLVGECQKVFCFRSEGVIVNGAAIEIVASALTITAFLHRRNDKHYGNQGTFLLPFLGFHPKTCILVYLNKEFCRFVTSSVFSFRTITFTNADKKITKIAIRDH